MRKSPGFLSAAIVCGALAAGRLSAAGPAFVDITWMSISNVYYEVGRRGGRFPERRRQSGVPVYRRRSRGPLQLVLQHSASPVDLHLPIVVDGADYGAPLDNLKYAMTDANLTSVDLWIGSSAVAVAQLVGPILKPKAFLPVHWDGLWGAFDAGVPKAFADGALEQLLTSSNTAVVAPAQYMDKWRLDRTGVRPIANTEVKKALGFN